MNYLLPGPPQTLFEFIYGEVEKSAILATGLEITQPKRRK